MLDYSLNHVIVGVFIKVLSLIPSFMNHIDSDDLLKFLILCFQTRIL